MPPNAIGAVLDLLRLASRRTQVVAATHSPELLDAKWIEDRHLRIVAWEKGATRVARLSQAASGCLRDRLMGAGELLRANALTAEPTLERKPGPPILFERVAA